VWNGATWRVVTIQHPPQFFSGGLTDVSCASSTECPATGFYFTSVQGNSFSLADLWNGQRWRILNPPRIELDTVSCTSASFCMAVGNSTGEMWNGRKWRTQKLPGLFGIGPGITGVSCVSRSDLQGVEGFNVAEFWSGTARRRLATAGPGGGCPLPADDRRA